MGHYKGRDNRKRRRARMLRNNRVIFKKPIYGEPLLAGFYAIYAAMQEMRKVVASSFILPKELLSDVNFANYASSLGKEVITHQN